MTQAKTALISIITITIGVALALLAIRALDERKRKRDAEKLAQQTAARNQAAAAAEIADNE